MGDIMYQKSSTEKTVMPPVVTEYDRGLLINDMRIPCVLKNGVEYDPDSQIVTIRLACRSFIKYSGEASRRFEIKKVNTQ